MKIYKLSQENQENQNYFYSGSCCDTDNGMRVYQIVEQDDLTYPEETYFHNPENAISEKEFLSKVPNPKTNYDWWGWNKSIDIIFGYNFDLDRHDFYEK